MDETSDQLAREIEQTRGRLGEDLGELKGRLRRELNWRTHYEDHPVASLGLAVGVGVLVGAILRSNAAPPRRKSPQKLLPPPAPAPNLEWPREEHKSRPIRTWAKEQAKGHAGTLGRALENTFAAIIGVGTARLLELLNGAMPGFRDEFQKASNRTVSPTVH